MFLFDFESDTGYSSWYRYLVFIIHLFFIHSLFAFIIYERRKKAVYRVPIPYCTSTVYCTWCPRTENFFYKKNAATFPFSLLEVGITPSHFARQKPSISISYPARLAPACNSKLPYENDRLCCELYHQRMTVLL